MAQQHPVRESAVEAALVRYASQHGVWSRKFSSPARRGVPDRIFMKHGVVLFMEIKRPGNTPNALQLQELAEIKKHGGYSCWCDTVAGGCYLLEHYFGLL
jgi:hypothetical protein